MLEGHTAVKLLGSKGYICKDAAVFRCNNIILHLNLQCNAHLCSFMYRYVNVMEDYGDVL